VELSQVLNKLVVDALPFASVLVVGGVALWLVNRWLAKRAAKLAGEGEFRRQLTMSLLALVFLVALVVAAPVKESTQQAVVTLFGIAITGVIALSSTTFASNAMAGLMLRLIRNFRQGDYVRVGEFFGRVSERGLLHTEIQNERSDLITLPNLYLVTNAVTVIRPKGTFITARVSLGYDLQHTEIERLLLDAAEGANLKEAFVRIRELGDFSVSYEVSGLLDETKRFLGSKTALHRSVLDTLHSAGVEIVSPAFMNQRPLKPGQQFIPEVDRELWAERSTSAVPDQVVFDKAEQMERAEQLRSRLADLDVEITDLEAQIKASSEDDTEAIERNLGYRKRIRERLATRIQQIEEQVDD
jgi:small-conductance mechanosensitive channel